MNKLVSVAVTTYNGERYIREQLDSIVNQTYKNIEIIVCDDCSTDDTLKILKEYETKYGIQIFTNDKNIGYIKNYEKVISKCNGEYIALSDQDDVWISNKIQLLINNIFDSPLIMSDAYVVDKNKSLISDSFLKYQNIDVPKYKEQFVYLLFRNFATGCTMLFHKDLLNNAIPFPEKIPHDWWIALNASIHGRIEIIKKPLILYRQHDNNTIGAIKYSKSTKKNNIINIQFRNRKRKIIDSIIKNTKMIDELKCHYNKLELISIIENDYQLFIESIQNKNLFHYKAFIISLKYRKYWYEKHRLLFSFSKIIV